MVSMALRGARGAAYTAWRCIALLAVGSATAEFCVAVVVAVATGTARVLRMALRWRDVAVELNYVSALLRALRPRGALRGSAWWSTVMLHGLALCCVVLHSAARGLVLSLPFFPLRYFIL